MINHKFNTYICIPENVQFILSKLSKEGYKAYVVGGCVRDSLLNIIPKDYDICSNALPEQVKEIFEDYNTILTGEKHGTVTVVIEGEQIEITTFRIDGEYSNNRKPDSDNYTYDMSKVKEYIPKTKIPDIIADVLLESNYKDDYNWKYDNIFIAEGIRVEVIDYSIKTSDWCIIKINGKEIKVSKKYLREIYENRTVE